MIIGDGEAPRQTWLTLILPSRGSGKTPRDWGRESQLLRPKRTWSGEKPCWRLSEWAEALPCAAHFTKEKGNFSENHKRCAEGGAEEVMKGISEWSQGQHLA